MSSRAPDDLHPSSDEDESFERYLKQVKRVGKRPKLEVPRSVCIDSDPDSDEEPPRPSRPDPSPPASSDDEDDVAKASMVLDQGWVPPRSEAGSSSEDLPRDPGMRKRVDGMRYMTKDGPRLYKRKGGFRCVHDYPPWRCSQCDALKMPTDAADLSPLPDPGRGKRINGMRYVTTEGVRLFKSGQFCCEHEHQPSTCLKCIAVEPSAKAVNQDPISDPGRGKRKNGVRYTTTDGPRLWKLGMFMCEHDRKQEWCYKCEGSQICIHKMLKHNCGKCGGTQVCTHGKQKTNCRKCGGASFCKHDKRRNSCGDPECGGGQRLCVCCRYFILSPLKLKQPPELRLCDTCEAQRDPELGNKKSWEALCMEQVLPQITYADGTPFPPDQLDERKGGGLGTSRAVKGPKECDTFTNRFPDSLWIRRHPVTARALLACLLEIDEHSHTDYLQLCEVGKVDDTVASIQKRLAKEGNGECIDATLIPIFIIKLNPNACDATPSVSLSNRLKVATELMNRFLQLEEDEIADLCRRGLNEAPLVQCLYYHSKEGGHHLTYFEENTKGNWRWLGNHCGTNVPELPF